MADPVFVQPHFDDVALSCGGTVAALAERGAPTIVTVFGGEPIASASSFAQTQHRQWRLDDSSAVAHRRREDQAAAAELGPSVNILQLDFLDAIYRQSAYASDEALFGEPMAGDKPLIDRIAAELAELGDIFALPLAVGNHVDHQLTYLAGRRLRQAGMTIWHYADLPYALDHDAYHSRLEALGNLESCRRTITTEQFDRRWRAIECYISQLPVIFRDIDDPRAQFERFATIDDRELVEQFWNLEDVKGE